MEEDVKDPSKEMHSSIHRQDADKCLVAMAIRGEGEKGLLLVIERRRGEEEEGIIMQAVFFVA